MNKRVYKMIDGLVSIIMPSWNTARWIGESIESVINQTYKDWELIVVDDCSTDNTDEVVASYHDPRIRYLKNDKNSGAALTRNRALREAQGEWIAFLDSDDLWCSNKLERMIGFMKKNGYSFAYHEYEKIDEEGKRLNIRVSGPRIVTKRRMYHYGYPGCLTFMYSAKIHGLIQIKDIKKNNDYAILLKLCKESDCYLLDESLAKYRIRKKSISHDKLTKKLMSHYDLFHFCDEKPALIAFWYACWNLWYGFWKKNKYEKKHYKACIIGHFGFGKELINGQTIKTKSVADELSKTIGDDNLLKLDTHGGFKAFLKAPFQVKKALKECDNVIVLLAHRGICVFAPLLIRFNKRKQRKIHYVVVGGWLPELSFQNQKLARSLKQIDCILVETSTMKKALENQGYSNIVIMTNFKNVIPIEERELILSKTEPFCLCTFSRVMKEKGIEEIVDVVNEINRMHKKTIFTLDIYGPIDEKQIEWFKNLKQRFGSAISYKGVAVSDKSPEIIKQYYLLVFPTKFYTEGIPGTIIDAYCAGVPVVASKWESSSDVVDDGVTGFLYNFDDKQDLLNCLERLRDCSVVNSLKLNCLKKASLFSASASISKIELD